MTVSNTLLDQVRQRARFACEYRGVTETDSGGVLTLDHCAQKFLSLLSISRRRLPPIRARDYALPPGSSERRTSAGSSPIRQAVVAVGWWPKPGPETVGGRSEE